MDITEFLSRVQGAKPNGKGWLAHCPAHDDQHASLSIAVGDDGRILIKCFAGCEPDVIVNALGNRMADLYPNSVHSNGQGKQDWPALAKKFSEALTPERRRELAQALGLPEWSLTKLPVGWYESEQCWPFPECDGQRRIIGINRRYRDGSKRAMAGSKRGLTIPDGWDKGDRPIFLPEGASNTLALTALGLSAVGRPNNTGGVDHLAELLGSLPSKRPVILLGDIDGKPDGKWPGRDGAVKVAGELAGRLPGWKVFWVLPPDHAKDVREWVKRQDLDPTLADAWDDAGQRLLSKIESALQVAAPKDNTGERSVEPVIVKLSDVEMKPVNWLWRNWTARGCMTLFDGDPGLGKSTTTLDIAARVTRGWKMPPEGGPAGTEPAYVLILSAEDTLEQVIKPRLAAMGADMSRIIAMPAMKVNGEEMPVTLPIDLDAVEEMIKLYGVILVIIDPLVAYLDGKTDSHNDANIRRVLYRVKLLAERTQAAVLAIRHLNKVVNSPALYRGGGSIGIIGAARSAWVVGKDPQNPGHFVLAMNKSNLGPIPRSLAYRIDPVYVEPVGHVGTIGWVGECDLGPNEILAKPKTKPGPKGEALSDAVAFLEKALAEGPKEAGEVEKWAKAECISVKTLRRAKKELGVDSKLEGYGSEGKWHWSLPARDNQAGPPPVYTYE
jgi:hypothetical protein